MKKYGLILGALILFLAIPAVSQAAVSFQIGFSSGYPRYQYDNRYHGYYYPNTHYRHHRGHSHYRSYRTPYVYYPQRVVVYPAYGYSTYNGYSDCD